MQQQIQNNVKNSVPEKIAILYIALGRYGVFWKDFYRSCEKYFLSDCKKTYFLWTDNKKIDFEKNKNVVKINQKKLGWPYDTMMRFDLFLQKETELKNFDYIFFFNANMIFKKEVGKEILPDDDNDGLVVGLHPWFRNSRPDEFTYDRNPDSTSCIPFGEGKVYVQGCLNGGTAAAYLELCRICKNNIDQDLKNGVIALWHDESHLNKYILNKNPLIMPHTYLYPENWKMSEDVKIVQLDKTNPKYGGIEWLRGISNIRQKAPLPFVVYCKSCLKHIFSVSKNDKHKFIKFLGIKIALRLKRHDGTQKS